MNKKQKNLNIIKKPMTRKRKGSHRACKEWAPSVILLQPNINRIIHAKINGIKKERKKRKWKAEVK